jgi:hypothetical protein
MTRQAGIEDRITLFVGELQKYTMLEYTNRGYAAFSGQYEVEYGQKFARIVRQNSQRMVYCFVDLSNGDILKADSYRKPSKRKRGSIWNEGCDVGNNKPCDLYGSGLYKR